ncbi:hypothetical protein CBS101457_005300 [Exobasidium rhododendri]|nr:hypothetical protein CBS101457_005300 [Exobasidium rhododendri]
MAGDYVALPVMEEDIFDINNVPASLSVYTKPNGRVSWYFCKDCGCHLLQSARACENKNIIKWDFSMGVMYPLALEDGTKIAKLDRHIFVNHSLDQGGLTRFLPDGVPRYVDGSIEECSIADPNQKPTDEEQETIRRATTASTMPVKCHCGRVRIDVRRPSTAPIKKDDEDVVVDDKWLWTLCLCSSCRTTSGFDSSSYLFAPYTHMSRSTTDDSHPTAGLKMYSSYPGRHRWFCSTCGCKFFFDRTDRGDLADLFLGAVDIPLAAAFSSWIHQAKSVSFKGYARNREYAQTLINGFCPTRDLRLSENEIKQSADYTGSLQLM